MREVICQDTKIKVPQNEAYKVCKLSKNGTPVRNEYWSSEQAYNSHLKMQQYRNECLDRIRVILDLEGLPIPTFVNKKLKELEQYGYDNILDTINEQIESIEWAVNNKNFTNDFSKTSYIFAIITNNIGDVIKKKRSIEKQRSSIIDNVPIIDSSELDQIGHKGSKKSSKVQNLLGDLE